MTRTWIATLANFFFPGAGYLILGEKRDLSFAWIVGVVGLTYVETSVQTEAPHLYLPMFASVLLINTAFAADVYRLGKARSPASGRAAVSA